MKEFYEVWVPPVLLWLCVEQLLQRGVLSIVKVSCVECPLPLSNNQGYTSLPSRRSSKECVCRMALPFNVCVPSTDPILYTKPTLLELRDHVVLRVAAHWDHFGLALRMEDYLLDIIKANMRGEVVACCTDMLKRWLRKERATGGEERSWSTILSAVQRCFGQETARSIAESLKAAQ